MRIQVIGAYLPRLDQKAISTFIAEDVAGFVKTMRQLLCHGVTRTTEKEIRERAAELPAELDADLQACALFEVEVRENDGEFDPSQFQNPETGLCGWEPAFLSTDGKSIVFEGYSSPSDLRDFRVAFYIHQWSEPGRLVGPTGALKLPKFTKVPKRLWKLAPYALVD